jgi:uncharacterized protein YyaL (SSP411 family)
MRRLLKLWSVVRLALLLSGCAGATEGAKVAAPAGATTAASADPMRGAPREELHWATYSAETFARAKRERKFIVMDGSAEWCHWCHVMEAESYHDPRVRKLLDERFIAVKVDVDARPDLEERYGDWGWPATIVFSPDATEIAKYKGFIAPDDFVRMLTEVVTPTASPPPTSTSTTTSTTTPTPTATLTEQTLSWIQHDAALSLDEYWDDEEGGWGRNQKAPIGPDNAWLLSRARAGDADARKKALFVLDQQSKIIDPVWGGIYQYSAARDWDHPHFEKLMTFQAPAIENYAEAYALTKEPRFLARAQAMLSFVDGHMRGADGGFYTTVDADVNAHDASKPFMSGHDYYAQGEAGRRKHGYPRVDTHEYARENGLAIAAHVTFYEATGDARALETAKTAANRVYSTHASKTGGVAHDGNLDARADATVLFLADNAAFGLALVRLYEATHERMWLDRALAIAAFIEKELADPEAGGLFASTKDPDAAGVFAKRRTPFEHEITAIRFFARLAKAEPAWAATHGCFVSRLVAAVSTPEQLHAQGRWLGDYLLALDETKGFRTCVR